MAQAKCPVPHSSAPGCASVLINKNLKYQNERMKNMKKLAKIITLLTALTMMLSAFTAIAAAPVPVDNLETDGTYVFFDDFEGYEDTNGDGVIGTAEYASNWTYNNKPYDSGQWPPKIIEASTWETDGGEGGDGSNKLKIWPKATPSNYHNAPSVTFTGSVPMNSIQKFTFDVEKNRDGYNGYGIRFMKHNNGQDMYELYFPGSGWSNSNGAGEAGGYIWILSKITGGYTNGTRTFLYTNEGAVNSTTLPASTQNRLGTTPNRVNYVTLTVNGKTGTISFDVDNVGSDVPEGKVQLMSNNYEFVDLATTVTDTSFVGIGGLCTFELFALGFFNSTETSAGCDFDNVKLEVTADAPTPPTPTDNLATEGKYVYFDDFETYPDLDKNGKVESAEYSSNWTYNKKPYDDGQFPPIIVKNETWATNGGEVGETLDKKLKIFPKATPSSFHNAPGVTFTGSVPMKSVQKITFNVEENRFGYNGYGIRFMKHNNGQDMYELYFPASSWSNSNGAGVAGGYIWILSKITGGYTNGTRTFLYTNEGVVNSTTLPASTENRRGISPNRAHTVQLVVNGETGEISFDVDTANPDSPSNAGKAQLMSNNYEFVELATTVTDTSFVGVNDECTVELFAIGHFNTTTESEGCDFDNFKLEATAIPSSATTVSDDFSSYTDGDVSSDWITTKAGALNDEQPTINGSGALIYPNKNNADWINLSSDNYSDGVALTTWQTPVSADDVHRIKVTQHTASGDYSSFRDMEAFGMRFMIHNDGKNFYELLISSPGRVKNSSNEMYGRIYSIIKNQEVEENGSKVVKRSLVGSFIKEGYNINRNMHKNIDVTVNNAAGTIDVNITTNGTSTPGTALLLNPSSSDNESVNIKSTFYDDSFKDYHGDTSIGFFGACSVNWSSASSIDDFSVTTTDAYEVSGEPDATMYVDVANGKTADANGVIDLGTATRVRRVVLPEYGEAFVSLDGNNFFSIGEGVNILNRKSGLAFRYVKAPTGSKVLTDISEITVPLYSDISVAYYEMGYETTDIYCYSKVVDYDGSVAYVKSQPTTPTDVEFMAALTSKVLTVSVTDPYTVTSENGKLKFTAYLDKALNESGNVSGIVIFEDENGALIEAQVAPATLKGNIAEFEVDDVADADGVKLTVWKDVSSSVKPLSNMYTIR